jgi:serine/threonine-protein kinase
MSPEQASGELVDHRADIYALGIVMYEMFTGKVPFEADSYMGVLTKHMYMAPAPPSELRRELKELGALEDVILRCLQKRPAARYENLAALLAALERRVPTSPRGARGARSLLADQLELPSHEEVFPRRSSKLAPSLIVGAAFLAGLLLVVALRRPSGSAGSPSAQASRSAPAGKLPAAPAQAASGPASPGAGQSGVSVATAAPASARPSTTNVPAKRPSLTAPRPVAPTAPAPVPRKRKPPSGEIVDPWARRSVARDRAAPRARQRRALSLA